MRLGVGFAHGDIGTDPVVIRRFAEDAEAAGFDFISSPEHVAGAHPDRFTGPTSLQLHRAGSLDQQDLLEHTTHAQSNRHDTPFHEPLTLFAYLAGVTRRLEFISAVLVLPQRQTVLVAKQAAEVSMLSGGRLRLGVGLGWNFAEYEALGVDFADRARRQAEQIVILRRLWSEPLVTFEGEFHHLDRVAIAPLPSEPIPIWMGGGGGESTLRRIARLGDGWIPAIRENTDVAGLVSRMQRHLEQAGRQPSALQILMGLGDTGDAKEWVATAKHFGQLGATHIRVLSAHRPSGKSAMAQLDQAIEVKRVLGLELGY